MYAGLTNGIYIFYYSKMSSTQFDDIKQRKKILRRLVHQLPDRSVVLYAALLCQHKPRVNYLAKYVKRAICSTIKKQKDNCALELLI